MLFTDEPKHDGGFHHTVPRRRPGQTPTTATMYTIDRRRRRRGAKNEGLTRGTDTAMSDGALGEQARAPGVCCGYLLLLLRVGSGIEKAVRRGEELRAVVSL